MRKTLSAETAQLAGGAARSAFHAAFKFKIYIYLMIIIFRSVIPACNGFIL